MNIDGKLRTMRTLSLTVTGFALLLLLAGIAQLGVGGIAVSAEYDRIEQREALMGSPRTYYGYQQQQRQIQAEYDRSSSAFFLEGRFLQTSLDGDTSLYAKIAFGTFLFAVLGFLVSALGWVWRATANLRDIGIRMKYGPGFITASYLIPIANLVIPFESMRELHNRSHGEGDDFAHSGVENVTAWWTSLLTGLLIFSALVMKFVVDAGTNLILMTPLWMEFAIMCFAIVLLLAAAWLFANLTREITAAQQEVLPQVDPTAHEEAAPARPTVTIVGG